MSRPKRRVTKPSNYVDDDDDDGDASSHLATIRSYKTHRLRQELKKRKLDSGGDRQSLIQRLLATFGEGKENRVIQRMKTDGNDLQKDPSGAVVIETHTRSEPIVALHHREPYNIDWESIFLTTNDADTDSIVFVKRILFITLSQILYFRKLLPPNSFQHYHLEGTDFTFTSVSPIDDAGFIAIEALSGTFDAMDRKYLRSFVVPVLDMSKSDCNTKFVHESYRINFSYANDGTPHIVYSSREGEEEIRCFTIQDDLKKAGLDFLTRVSGHIAALPPLPENCRPIYQLAYYDRRTPPDYEPLGFHADNMLHIVQKTCSLDHSYISDSVTTKFHGYSLSVRLRDMAAKELDDTIVAQSQETVVSNDGGWNGDDTDETLFKSEASSEADSSEDFFADTS